MKRKRLDSEMPSEIAIKLLESFISVIKGQDKAIMNLVDAIEIYESELFSEGRPIYVGLCAGPSGVGKTLTAELLAEYWFGNRQAITKIACEEFSQSHEVARLIGSPAGYLGHYDPKTKSGTPPLLMQENIDRFDVDADPERQKVLARINELGSVGMLLQEGMAKSVYAMDHCFDERGAIKPELMPVFEKVAKDIKLLVEQHKAVIASIKELDATYPFIPRGRPKSIILFDEIEKANPTLHNMILNIMDKARLQMADGSITDFSNSVILLTTNVGSRAIAEILNPEKKIGFGKSGGKINDSVDREIYKKTLEELKRVFPPEFLARPDRISVYRPLSREILGKIVDVELRLFQKNVLGNFPIILSFDEKVKEFILDEATDKPENGARLVKNKIQRYLRKPLCRLKNRGEIDKGDTIYVSLETRKDGKPVVVFEIEERKKQGTKPKEKD